MIIATTILSDRFASKRTATKLTALFLLALFLSYSPLSRAEGPSIHKSLRWIFSTLENPQKVDSGRSHIKRTFPTRYGNAWGDGSAKYSLSLVGECKLKFSTRYTSSEYPGVYTIDTFYGDFTKHKIFWSEYTGLNIDSVDGTNSVELIRDGKRQYTNGTYEKNYVAHGPYNEKLKKAFEHVTQRCLEAYGSKVKDNELF